MLAYIFDENLMAEMNKNKQNYWDIYIREINELLGLRGTELSLLDLENINKLNEVKALIIGTLSGAKITNKMTANLDEWVRGGGMLIGFGLQGLDNIFGIETISRIKQEPDDYTISGYFELFPHDITREIHPVLLLSQKLFIVSDIQIINVKEEGTVKLALLYNTENKYLGHPAITWNQYGKGYAGYFVFDVAKTVWLLHQGRPIPECESEERFPKTKQLSIIGNNSRLVQYADEIVFLIQNMIAQKPQPFIYQIPPLKNEVPEALLYWAGDEYRGPVEDSLFASDFMKKMGLPMHINLEVETHPMTEEEFKHITQDNGHEISVYWRMRKEDNYDIKEKYFKKQSDIFLRRFGKRPGSTLLWSTKWKGWTEPARWMAEAGAKADNTFCSNGLPYTLEGEKGTNYHPYGNLGHFSFGFGTSYPFYFYEDYNYGNRRLDFMEQPIICYEIGHRGGMRPVPDNDTFAPEDVHLPIDRAVKYHLVMNMFYHPGSIHKSAATREAIREVVKYIDYKKALVYHMGNDQLCEWWNGRSRSTIEDINIKEDVIQFKTRCTYSSGMIVKVPIKDRSILQVTNGDNTLIYNIKKEFGNTWLYIIVPNGGKEIEIKFI